MFIKQKHKYTYCQIVLEFLHEIIVTYYLSVIEQVEEIIMFITCYTCLLRETSFLPLLYKIISDIILYDAALSFSYLLTIIKIFVL